MHDLCVTFEVTGGQNAPACWHQMRCELDFNFATCDLREFLIKLAQVSMFATMGIALHVSCPFCEQHVLLQRTPCPGNTVLQVADDVIQIDHIRSNQRTQRKLHRGCVAACASHQTGGFNVFAVKFGQAVDSGLLQFNRHMRRAVPFFISSRIAQPEISAKIDDFHVVWKIADECLGEAMRQCREHQIDTVKINLVQFDQIRQVHVAQMWEHVSHRLSCLSLSRQGHNLKRRMCRDNPD